ncbi:putative membrane protein YphA (DoxX/SURF4 family) [Kitasatospora sp. GP82]|nr:putative membrane protein YphA (DoxX/SURF4 family) [Kitasatospora sp. GP82]
MNTGLLLLRLVAGLLVAGHGVQKVSFHLGGRGLAGGTEEFRQDGFRGGVFTALTAGGSQIGAGLLLTAGLLTALHRDPLLYPDPHREVGRSSRTAG